MAGLRPADGGPAAGAVYAADVEVCRQCNQPKPAITQSGFDHWSFAKAED